MHSYILLKLGSIVCLCGFHCSLATERNWARCLPTGMLSMFSATQSSCSTLTSTAHKSRNGCPLRYFPGFVNQYIVASSKCLWKYANLQLETEFPCHLIHIPVGLVNLRIYKWLQPSFHALLGMWISCCPALWGITYFIVVGMFLRSLSITNARSTMERTFPDSFWQTYSTESG